MKVIERLRNKLELTTRVYNGLRRLRPRAIPNDPSRRQCGHHTVLDSETCLSNRHRYRAIQRSGSLEVLILLDAQDFSKIQIAKRYRRLGDRIREIYRQTWTRNSPAEQVTTEFFDVNDRQIVRQRPASLEL